MFSFAVIIMLPHRRRARPYSAVSPIPAVRNVIDEGALIDPSPTILRFDSIDSTNLAAARALRGGTLGAGPVVFVARQQTGGQGRRGRAWHSPPGGLWCTIIWPDASPPARRAEILQSAGLRLGLAALDAVRHALADTSPRAALRWPNDILIDGRKAAGCLCQALPRGDTLWLILGVGINANNDPDDLPADLRTPATSLTHELASPVDLDELLGALLRAWADRQHPSRSMSHDIAEASAALHALGEHVSVTMPDGTALAGTLRGIDDQARLLLEVGGELRIIPHTAELLDAGDSMA